MDDGNRLELNLGLSLGQSSSKPKDKSENSTDTRTEESDRSSKLINDFKNFLEGGTLKPECSTVSQRSDQAKPDHSFCNNFPNSAADVNASKSFNGKGLWSTNDNRAAEVEGDKRSDSSNKRKSFFDEMTNQKKREGESRDTEVHERSKPSHISINTDDDSTGEDVADSEAVGSTSRLVSHSDDGTRKNNRAGSHPESQKEVYTVVDSSMVEAQSQRRFTISSEEDSKVGKMPYGVPFPPQSVTILNLPYPLPAKDCNSVAVSSTAGYSQPGTTQVVTSTSNDRSGTHILPGSLPVMFGYSPVQLPVLDKDNLASHTQPVLSSYAGRATPNADKLNNGLKLSQASTVSNKPSEAPQFSGMGLEQGKSDVKQQNNGDVASSSQREDGAKGRNTAVGAKDESEFSTIRPGLAADVKFGGCGSYPNLPWVSTKGPGPNGRTISGVTYRFSPTQIKIVCACHGSHMSPEEFVRHGATAEEEQSANPDPGSAVGSLSGNNPATSAQS